MLTAATIRMPRQPLRVLALPTDTAGSLLADAAVTFGMLLAARILTGPADDDGAPA